MNNLINKRQRYLLVEREEIRIREERAMKVHELLMNVLCAICGIALCAVWYLLYWYVCP